jgi:hypothetical protein
VTVTLSPLLSEQEESADEQPLECDLCDERFAIRQQLKDHVWEYHEMGGDIPP